MTTDGLLILALVLLLLPVPLAFLIRAPAGAAPDPWRVRRARLSLVGFAAFVATIYLLFLQPRSPQAAAWGLLIWSGMSWFFFGVVVFELRRRKPEPFPGQTRRSASLRPRHVERPVPAAAWWLLGAAWAAATAWFSVIAADRTGGLILVLGAGFFVAIGPWLARRAVLDAEPLLADASPRLLRAYADRRRVRAWATFALMAVAVAINVGFAIDHLRPSTASPWPTFLVAMELLATIGVVYAALELRLRRRIRRLRSELAAYSSSQSQRA